jgi:hypothetical protein
MTIEPLEYIKYLCVALICGFIPPLIYDLIKCVLNFKNKIVILILDCLSVLVFTLVFILIIYYTCEGRTRGAFFLSLCSGAIIYIRWFRKFVTKLINFLMTPFRWIISLFLNFCKKINRFFIQTIAKIRSKLYNRGVK